VSGRASEVDSFPIIRDARPSASVAWRQWGWPAAIGSGVFALNLFISRYLFWDSYYDLAAGRYIANHGIPHHEVFTIEGGGKPWIDQQWLAHWLFYEVWSVGGYPLLSIVSSSLVASGFAGLAALMIKRGVVAQRALLWVLLAYVACLGNTVIRAQSFAYPLFVLVFWMILEDSRRRGFVWRFAFLLPLLLVWSNLHGTVALAAAVVAGYSLWRALVFARSGCLRDAAAYAGMTLVAPLAIFANPYGFGIRSYYSALVGNPVLRRYDLEWTHPSLADPWSWGFFVLLATIVASLVFAWRRGVRPAPVLLALAGCFLLIAYQGVRYQAWFAIVGALLGAEVLARTRRPASFPAAVQRIGGGAIALFATVSILVVLLTSNSTFEQLAPQGALAATDSYLRRHPTARILADSDSSSALLWERPRAIGHVAFDARLEQFPPSRLLRWFEFMAMNTSSWQALSRQYDAVLVSRQTHGRIVGALRATGWKIVYEDPTGALLARRPA